MLRWLTLTARVTKYLIFLLVLNMGVSDDRVRPRHLGNYDCCHCLKFVCFPQKLQAAPTAKHTQNKC